jgi:hypothetical protein
MSGEGRPTKARIFKLKATPQRKADTPPTVATEGDPIYVQFNPTSLRIQRNNDTSGGATTRAQRRQQPNEGHATLTMDLEFDTAEGGPRGEPQDVRELTGRIRQFVEPPPGKPKESTPRLRFEWGAFHFDGIVTSLTEEIDYFSAEGMPLRAKVSLSITGQDPAIEANRTGPGARADAAGGGADSGPGSPPSPTPDIAPSAQDGESLQQALSRLGLDPTAWRSAMAGLESPLNLAAGARLQVDTSASASAGIASSTGFGAGVSAGVGFDARLGAAASATATVSAGSSAQAEAGFALAAAGGVAATLRGVAAAEASVGEAQARGGFDVPGPRLPPGVVSASAAVSADQAVDVRASGYGRGVPLKPPPRQRAP